MYIKMEEDIIEEVSDLTDTDYENVGEFVPANNVVSMVEELLYKYNCLKEKYDDLEEKYMNNIEY